MYLNCAVLFSGDGIKWLKGKQEQKEIYSSAMGTWGMTAWQAISYMNVQAVEEMIVKHQGVSIVSGKKVTGYAVRLDGKAYIFHENGSRVQVRESTIIPVQDGVVDAMELMQDGGDRHSLYCLELSEQMMAELRENGARYLEDLAEWKEEDYRRVRGLGAQKKTRIQEKLKEYGLVDIPEEYSNNE